MQNTYKQIYHAIKEANCFQSTILQIGGHVFYISCEKDSDINHFTLDYFDNEKIIRLDKRINFVKGHTEESIKRITRSLFRNVMYRCIYDIRIYRSERRISRSDLEKCVNTHQEIIKHGLEFYGWRKAERYPYTPLYVIA